VGPVMVHELDPRCGQQIEEINGHHFWSAIVIVRAGEQLAADLARVWLEQSRVGAGDREINVAQEASAGSALLWIREVVPASVGSAEMSDAQRRPLTRLLEADQLPVRVSAYQV